MNNSNKSDIKISIAQYNELCKLLIEKIDLDPENANTLAHALMDISEATEKLYKEIIPKIFAEKDKEKFIELFWKVSEQFRHIQYHIDDAKLTELHYVKEKK